eukprot:51970_1
MLTWLEKGRLSNNSRQNNWRDISISIRDFYRRKSSTNQSMSASRRKRKRQVEGEAEVADLSESVPKLEPNNADLPNSNESWHSDLLRILECPICEDAMYAPIFQCNEGHTICGKCIVNINDPKSCPQCRLPLGETRSRVAEDIIQKIPYPCKNSVRGCSHVLLGPERTDHETTCEFMIFACPCVQADCRWTGIAGEVIDHLSESHDAHVYPEDMFGGKEQTRLLTSNDGFNSGIHWPAAACVKGRKFVLFAELRKDLLFVVVRHIAPFSVGRFHIR